ncbi:MAG: hypothetical protein CFR70_08700 [Rhodocyclaceae bacterium]|nr:MAG: hypothetical protein CFR70_08700 [Rhodocyclaceae bacterium]
MHPGSHLFVDISSHGFGHLAITAPVLNRLADLVPDLRLTIRSGLPATKLAQRIHVPYALIPGSTDFGYVMHDATRIDLATSAAAYRAAHSDWASRVASEAAFIKSLAPDRVLTNVSYLPLAGAARVGIPAYSLCSLNWADLFAHYFEHEPWAGEIHAEMLAAYGAAKAFLRVTPGMLMPSFTHCVNVGVIAALGQRRLLPTSARRNVLIAMGGIAHRLPLEDWPRLPGICWLVPAAWQCCHPDALAFESLGLDFTDLLASVDAVITKPGYGTFTEAACNGTPVLYQRREDWPEQDCLIDWLENNGCCGEVTEQALTVGDLALALDTLWSQPKPSAPACDGALTAAQRIAFA